MVLLSFLYVELQYTSLDLQITDLQYQKMLKLADYTTLSTRRGKYRHLRPYTAITKDNTKVWWVFAVNAVLVEYRRKRAHISWDTLLIRLSQRKEYTSLYKENLHALIKGSSGTAHRSFSDNLTNMAEGIREEERRGEERRGRLKQLEDILEVKDIFLYRRIAEAEVGRAQAILERDKQSGWFSNLFSGLSNARGEHEDAAPGLLGEGHTNVDFLLQELTEDVIVPGDGSRVEGMQVTSLPSPTMTSLYILNLGEYIYVMYLAPFLPPSHSGANMCGTLFYEPAHSFREWAVVRSGEYWGREPQV